MYVTIFGYKFGILYFYSNNVYLELCCVIELMPFRSTFEVSHSVDIFHLLVYNFSL